MIVNVLNILLDAIDPAVIMDIIVMGLLKALIRRPRPSENMSDHQYILSEKYSMPSGHASFAVLLYVYVLLNFHLSMLWMDVLKIWAIFVMASRLAMARHYLSDVVVGGIIGFIEAQLVSPSMIWVSLDSLKKAILE